MDLADVCDGQYLTDHHQRSGEQLLMAEIDSSTSIAEVREQLLGEFEACMPDPDDGRDMPSLTELMAAMDACLPIAREDETFDPTLPGGTTAWFLVTTKDATS